MYVFPAFCYLTRAGSALIALDSFDEAVPDVTPAGLLSLFTDVAQVLSTESAVVMSSRLSFLQDSPQTRRLLDGTRLMSEKLAQQLHARGVDPRSLPRFSVMRLHAQAGESLLAAELRQQTPDPQGRTVSAGPARREIALAAAPHPRLTEEVREFLYRRTLAETAPTQKTGAGTSDPTATCIVPAGIYLVGPSHQLMLRRLGKPIRMSEFAVTVAQYKRFLDLVSQHGSAEWDHPDTPADHSRQPPAYRLPVPSYYQDPAYDSRPAVAVSWWSAYAFARSEGKRLPTSLEWEAAARGFDGCGGSYDNPYRAVQASSKGTCHRDNASDLVGFRCTEDLT